MECTTLILKGEYIMTNTYTEAKKAIDKIRSKDEFLFRMAVSHLYDVGYRHLTEENVNETIADIMKRDDSHSIMTNEYQADIVRTAYELSKFDHIHLMVYIQREVAWDVGDGGICYERVVELLCNCIDDEMENIGDTGEIRYALIDCIGFNRHELKQLGYDYLFDTEEDEDNDEE